MDEEPEKPKATPAAKRVESEKTKSAEEEVVVEEKKTDKA
jgi:hypothetical protein